MTAHQDLGAWFDLLIDHPQGYIGVTRSPGDRRQLTNFLSVQGHRRGHRHRAW
jgi:hypothetical protein